MFNNNRDRDLILIPSKYFEKRNKKIKITIILLTSLLGIIIISILAILPLRLMERLRQDKINTENKLVEKIDFYKVGKQYDLLNQEVAGREKAVTVLNTMQGIKVTEIIENIQKGSPREVSIDSLSLTKPGDRIVQVNITGHAASEIELATFILALEKNEYFSEVNVTSINNSVEQNTKETYSNFVLNLKISAGM